MWVRGKDKENPGKFQYELYDNDGNLVERVGGFDSHFEADRAAEIAQRRILFPIDTSFDDLSLDEIMSELLE